MRSPRIRHFPTTFGQAILPWLAFRKRSAKRWNTATHTTSSVYALLLGVRPHEIHEWYLAVYVDAIEWVELPNVIGMSQFADGGRMASKPYAATGKYIQRMSNYCSACPFDPAESIGERACPFTTLYWDFLMRNEERLISIPRMDLQRKNLDKLPAATRRAITERAEEVRAGKFAEKSAEPAFE
jgi:deoxyribodipyrimidine photolyase-related protein